MRTECLFSRIFTYLFLQRVKAFIVWIGGEKNLKGDGRRNHDQIILYENIYFQQQQQTLPKLFPLFWPITPMIHRCFIFFETTVNGVYP